MIRNIPEYQSVLFLLTLSGKILVRIEFDFDITGKKEMIIEKLKNKLL